MLPAHAPEQSDVEALLAHATCSLVGAGWYPCEPSWVLPPRVQPFYSLFICAGGGANFVVDGTPHRLVPGGVLLSPPHVAREARHDPQDSFQVYVCWFNSRLFGVVDLPGVLGLPVCWVPDAGRFREIVDAAEEILGELAAREPGHVLAANSACGRLVGLLWRDVLTAGASGPRPAQAAAATRLAPVFQLIHARFRERLTLDELAATVHLHPAYLSTLFRRLTGHAPLRYIARYRLDRVRELLLSTDLSIRQIAEATGFRDAYYLSRVFSAAEGESPSEFRKVKKNPVLA